jgi:hypothetical protein
MGHPRRIVVQLRRRQGLIKTPEPPFFPSVFGYEKHIFEDPMDLIKAIVIGAAVLAPVTASAQDLAPMALNSLPAPPPKITTAQVENLHGQVIGRVEKIVTDPSGKPAAIAVVSSEGTRVVAAGAASYDEARNLVITDLPAPQLANAR